MEYSNNVESVFIFIKYGIIPLMQFAIPTHYKTIVGSIKDVFRFKDELSGTVRVEILMN